MGLVLLNVAPGTSSVQLAEALAEMTAMLDDLAGGHVRELDGVSALELAESRDALAGLEILLGFGRRLFDPGIDRLPLTQAERPAFLSYLPKPQPFPAIPWAEPSEDNLGEADLLLQLTAPEPASVNRAAVEAWKLVIDRDLPLEFQAFYDGFGRPDGRGWLEFHDGVSNLHSTDRRAAIEAQGDPDWMKGGTYLAFLRLRIDLATWRSLGRTQQELMIGRDKLTGQALASSDREPGDAAAQADRSTNQFRDPPETLDPKLAASHLHRANQNRSSPYASAGLRIFRQGYDFLESIGPAGPRLGLNFISYQADLSTVQHLLHLPNWLGDVNLGGPSRDGVAGEVPMVSLIQGGLYAVPPRRQPFPGADIIRV